MKKWIQLVLLMVFLNPSVLVRALELRDDLIYVPVEPCRLADTRNAGGPIAAGESRNFWVSGIGVSKRGGNLAGCPPPRLGLKPLAISAYVVAVPTPGSLGGVLTAYPSDQPPPPPGTSSTVNYSAGEVTGNTASIKLCEPDNCPIDGEFAILARNTDQHVVIDVQGYFYPVTSGGCPVVGLSSFQDPSPPTRFIDNMDGTICDTFTGLMWEQKRNLDGIPDLSDPHDADNNYTWLRGDDLGSVFSVFLSVLNNTSVVVPGRTPFAFYTDWRIPTIWELRTLTIDSPPSSVCEFTPCIIDSLLGPTRPTNYWSSSTWIDSEPESAWTVNFSDGEPEATPKTFGAAVRAVRGGRDYWFD